VPKVNIYLPDDLAAAVREAKVPVSAVCQAALERAVRDVTAARSADEAGPSVDGPNVGLYARFTPKARNAVVQAQQSAHGTVGTEHVLLGLLDQPDNVATRALVSLDVEPEDLRAELLASMDPVAEDRPPGHVPFSPESKQALEQATKEAVGLGHNYIGCEHLLLGVLATEDSLGSKVLRRMGVELRTTRRAVAAALGALMAERATPAPAAASTSTLDKILARLDAIERRLPPEA
jgi:ATP-dependent Clp protease ATP-binding subunit ClpA